jgi:hypothetical protein
MKINKTETSTCLDAMAEEERLIKDIEKLAAI